MASLVISHPKTERQSSNQSRSEAKTFIVYSTIVSHMANQQPQLYSGGGWQISLIFTREPKCDYGHLPCRRV